MSDTGEGVRPLPQPVFVTGLPGSGTTWAYSVLAKHLHGGEDVFWSSGRKGGEFKPLRRYALRMTGTLLGHVEPTRSPWPLDGRDEYLAEHPVPDIPELVKVPDWGVCRLYEEYAHRSVLIVRPVGAWLESVRKKRRSLDIPHGELAEGVERAIERMTETADAVVGWPDAIRDPDLFSDAVGFDVSAAVGEVTVPEWVSC